MLDHRVEGAAEAARRRGGLRGDLRERIVVADPVQDVLVVVARIRQCFAHGVGDRVGPVDRTDRAVELLDVTTDLTHRGTGARRFEEADRGSEVAQVLTERCSLRPTRAVATRGRERDDRDERCSAEGR